jgi:hypothetical protein
VLKVKVTATRTGFQPVATTLTLPKVATGTFTPARPASLGGEPRPGATLMLDLGTVSPTPAGTTLRWLRDGVAIRGADQPTYVTTAADLGARLSAQVTRTRAGYAPLVSTTEASHRIRSVPTVRVTARPGGGLARVWVTVLAQGTSPVTGVVRVAWRGKVTRDLTLSGGTTSTTLTGIPAGARHLHVHYLGSRTVTSHLERRVVDVR